MAIGSSVEEAEQQIREAIDACTARVDSPADLRLVSAEVTQKLAHFSRNGCVLIQVGQDAAQGMITFRHHDPELSQ